MLGTAKLEASAPSDVIAEGLASEGALLVLFGLSETSCCGMFAVRGRVMPDELCFFLDCRKV